MAAWVGWVAMFVLFWVGGRFSEVVLMVMLKLHCLV